MNHRNIFGNEKANELVKSESILGESESTISGSKDEE